VPLREWFSIGREPDIKTKAIGGIFILLGELIQAIVSAGPFLSAAHTGRAFDSPHPLPFCHPRVSGDPWSAKNFLDSHFRGNDKGASGNDGLGVGEDKGR